MKMTNAVTRLVYMACLVLVMTTTAGLVWLHLLNRFLAEAGNPIPMAGLLSVVLATLVISMVAYMIRTAKNATFRAQSSEAKQ